MAKGTCSIDGCWRMAHCRGWCKAHYGRWWKHGDPLVVLKTGVPARPVTPCFVEGCCAPIYKRDWCNAHYIRWRRHGDPLGGASSRLPIAFEMRACTRCHRELPPEAFPVRSGEERRDRRCRRCMAELKRELSRIHTPLRKARKRAAPVIEHVDRLEVLERDQGICGICGLAVDPEDFHVDHVIPLSKGGEHSYANVQAAHPLCNMRKHARMEVFKTPG